MQSHEPHPVDEAHRPTVSCLDYLRSIFDVTRGLLTDTVTRTRQELAASAGKGWQQQR